MCQKQSQQNGQSEVKYLHSAGVDINMPKTALTALGIPFPARFRGGAHAIPFPHVLPGTFSKSTSLGNWEFPASFCHISLESWWELHLRNFIRIHSPACRRCDQGFPFGVNSVGPVKDAKGGRPVRRLSGQDFSFFSKDPKAILSQ
jgi:hypothetical protein